MDKNGPSIIVGFPEIYKNNYIECRKRGGRIRFITDINKDNIQYCKELFKDGAVDEFRHLESFTGGIAISESALSIIIKVYSKSKKNGEGRGVQWITTIDNENLDIVRIFLSIGVQVRHLRNLPPINFAVDISIFSELWKNGMTQSKE